LCGLPKNLALIFFISLSAFAQEKPKQAISNPVAGDAIAIREGESLFRANCSPCHGPQARGGARGPDMTSGRWVHGGTDPEIFHTIEQGVPGTEMPANSFEDGEIWSLIAYLRSLSPSRAIPTGNATNGANLFFGKQGCSACHMVAGRGGLLGPDLTRIGAARSLQHLTDSIREPDKDFSQLPSDPNNHYAVPVEWASVTVITKQGQRITGVPKNEDAFTLQLMGEDSRLYLLLKEDLTEVQHQRHSLMPAYSEQKLSAAELQDLLSYLAGLRGEDK
jgi:putative heme-binding domain-containing protein